ncbi:Papain-like cysteine peptidase [Gracilaria domingensis]|nr:Papain-like cysteine peptidase [Gracilaria domingensis]
MNISRPPTLSSRILDRIQQARIGPVRYAHTDLFIGPFIGRHTSKVNYKRVCLEIGEPHRFRRHQPLLVVTSDSGFPDHRLIVVGGGHRILVAAHFLQIPILPYQVLDLSGLTEFDKPVSVLTHDALISHHLEATEPRPQPYSLMEQVLSFARLQEYWLWREEQKVIKSGKRPKRAPSMTQTKLMAAYDELKDDTAESSKYAIDFMSPPNPNTRHGYISGAQRLLKAGVVPFLCDLECEGLATFPRRTLNVVKTWSIEKIKARTQLWISRRKSGSPCDYRFTDTTGSEVDGRGRGRKRKATDISKLTDPPSGWEQYLDWKQMGSATLVQELQSKLDEEEKLMNKKDVLDANEVIVLNKKLAAMKQVQSDLDALKDEDSTSFDLAAMVKRAMQKYDYDTARNVSLMVAGGLNEDKFILYKDDYDHISDFSKPSDVSVLFTLMYLNQWDPHSVSIMHILESLSITNWFQKKLVEGKQPLLSLQSEIKSRKGKTYMMHQRCWHAELTLLPIVGAFHWTLAVLVNFPKLYDVLEHGQQKEGNDNCSPNGKTSFVFWFDSMHSSPHDGFDDNLIFYLQAAYPGRRSISISDLKKHVSIHHIREKLQKELECGFCVSYNVSLLSKRYKLLLNGDYESIRGYMKSMYKSYTLENYKCDVQRRLRVLSDAYAKNPGFYVPSEPLFWREKALSTTEKPTSHAPEPIKNKSKESQHLQSSLSVEPSAKEEEDDDDFVDLSSKRRKLNVDPGRQGLPLATPGSVPDPLVKADPKVKESQRGAPSQKNTRNDAQEKKEESRFNVLLRNALVGVLHGLIGMNGPSSDPIDIHAVTSSVFNDGDVKDQITRMSSGQDIGNAMETLTPIIIAKFRSLTEPTPPISSEPARSTAPAASNNTATKVMAPTPMRRQQLFDSSPVAIVEEGISLVATEKDNDIKQEWEVCFWNMQTLVAKMKNKSRQ